jgi:hypothetical protein
MERSQKKNHQWRKTRRGEGNRSKAKHYRKPDSSGMEAATERCVCGMRVFFPM